MRILISSKSPCHQGQTKCDMRGRDCIEENFSRKFYCNSTCEGIYADVQKVDNEAEEMMNVEAGQDLEEIMSKSEKELYRKFFRKIEKDLKRKGLLNREDSEDMRGQDRKKFNKLIQDFKKFKRNNVKHFKFNSASEETSFGLL